MSNNQLALEVRLLCFFKLKVCLLNYSLSSLLISSCVDDQAVISAFTNEANGMAKNTPQKPHKPPKNNTATIINTGFKSTASENNSGTSTLPSSA